MSILVVVCPSDYQNMFNLTLKNIGNHRILCKFCKCFDVQLNSTLFKDSLIKNTEIFEQNCNCVSRVRKFNGEYLDVISLHYLL